MVVYLEYAFLENFLLDGLLLYLALRCARGRVRPLNLVLAAAVGGGEALLFPLLPLPVWAAYPVKFAGGAILAVIAVSKGSKKTYMVAISAFFFLTFALGGLLTAIYSFFGVAYAEGSGYLVESAPVGLVVAVAGIFAVAVIRSVKGFYRYRKIRRALFSCRIRVGEKSVAWKAFADSGNCLTFRGEPVSVISAVAALALFRGRGPAGRMTVGTVNGRADRPVFRCDGLEIEGRPHGPCYFTVGDVPAKEYSVILHTALVEDQRETAVSAQRMAAKDTGK